MDLSRSSIMADRHIGHRGFSHFDMSKHAIQITLGNHIYLNRQGRTSNPDDFGIATDEIANQYRLMKLQRFDGDSDDTARGHTAGRTAACDVHL